eukprot:g6998.t1
MPQADPKSEGIAQLAVRMFDAGLDPRQEPAGWDSLVQYHLGTFRRLRQEAHYGCSDSWRAKLAPDFTRKLLEFEAIFKLPGGAYFEGAALLSRSPCTAPWDVQRFRFLGQEPTGSARERRANVPAEHLGTVHLEESFDLLCEVEKNAICNGFLVGQLGNLWSYLADQKGAKEEKTIQVGLLFQLALDGKLPEDLDFKKIKDALQIQEPGIPHWHPKAHSARHTRHSESILGELYDGLEEEEQKLRWRNQYAGEFCKNIHHICDASERVNFPRFSSGTKRVVGFVAVILGVLALGSMRYSKQCVNLNGLQGKSEVQMDAAIRQTAEKLMKGPAAKNRTLAEDTVLRAMKKAGHAAQKDWEDCLRWGWDGWGLGWGFIFPQTEHHIRKLDTLATLKDIQAVKDFRRGQHNEEAGNAECAFNVLEAFVSVVGMGDDLNGIVRTCPPPRDGESELACQVDASILVAWVGNLAAKISLAASNCALTLNVDSVCAAGVTGVIAGFGEISAGACLGAVTCSPTPPALSTTKISVLGDQTVRSRRLDGVSEKKPDDAAPGRRLLIGEGTIGNGVQCGVDVGMVAANIANMGLAINKAVNVNRCGKKQPLNVLKGIPDALCTVDIAGAVAYISQVVTFINLIVVHCQDRVLWVKAVAKINELWTLPDPLHRRLETETDEEPTPALEESLKIIRESRKNLDEHLAHLGMNFSSFNTYSQADKETLLNLMEGGLEEKPRAAGPFTEKRTLAVAGVLAAVLGVATWRQSNQCLNLGGLQGKTEVEMDAALQHTAEKLMKGPEAHNRTLAEDTVLRAMKHAGHDAQKNWEERDRKPTRAGGKTPAETEALSAGSGVLWTVHPPPGPPPLVARFCGGKEHHIRKLDTLATLKDIQAVKDFRRGQHNEEAGNIECAFNVLEAFVSVMGMGDDINGIIRTCPPPRDGESELACQVDASILVAWVGNLAAKISLAASNCALTLNVDSVCAAGVTGVVSAFGEISAGACLGAVTCSPTPPALTTTKISVLGDQTVRGAAPGRRLLIGEGTIGNGVQCGIDVGMVAANIANMGLAINKAVNVNRCGKFATETLPLNVLKGIPDALCTVDIAGAVAYISQVVTFINLIVVHCQDFLDVNALCAGSIAAITTGASAIAAYSGALHAACRYNGLLKQPTPGGAKGFLGDRVMWSLKTIRETRKNLDQHLAHLGMNFSSFNTYSQADKETLLNLMEGGMEKPRAAWPFQEC